MSGNVAIAQGQPPKPEVTTAEVQSYKPEKVIGEYQTDFLWDSNPNRKYNMKLAASAVNNTVLAPGEVFSFIEPDQDTPVQRGEDLLQRRHRRRQRRRALPGLLHGVHGGQLRGARDRRAPPALRRAPLHKAWLRRDGVVRGERLGRPGHAVQEHHRRLHSRPRVGRRQRPTQRPDPRPAHGQEGRDEHREESARIPSGASSGPPTRR